VEEPRRGGQGRLHRWNAAHRRLPHRSAAPPESRARTPAAPECHAQTPAPPMPPGCLAASTTGSPRRLLRMPVQLLRPRRCLFLRARDPRLRIQRSRCGYGREGRASHGRERGSGKAELGVVLGGGSTDASTGQGRPSWVSCWAAVPPSTDASPGPGISAGEGRRCDGDDNIWVFLVVEISSQ
jgi:hypothetical protein